MAMAAAVFFAKGSKIMSAVVSSLSSALHKRNRCSSLDTNKNRFENLSNLYPDAVIVKGTEWLRDTWDKKLGGETIDIIQVRLANLVKIKYRVFSDMSLSRMEITFPVQDSYQLLELMNGLVIPE
jgi:hypothetical protein